MTINDRVIALELTDPDPPCLPEPHPEEWKLRERGACARTGHHGFIRDGHQNRQAMKEAKAICQTCPVLDVCREVIDHIERGIVQDSRMAGVWAGETPNGRAVRRRQERKLAMAS